MRIRILFAALLLAGLACQKGRGDLPREYVEDIDRICNAERLSGALDLQEGERALRTAYWLERSLKTPEGRKFAASVVPLAPAAKAQRLAAEAQRAGIAPCPTAASWTGPPAP